MKVSSESLNIINTLAATLDDYELHEAINILATERKARHANALIEAKNNLAPGDKVEWYSGRSRGIKTGTVVKVKTKKAIVEETQMLQRWDIPMGMLKRVL